ncbi:uncharacterized protein LTR77_008595 [Saxophila tyrrhenica]|uniref:Uncharacterized protein n=1 Tax=Saxophila tyrrhenica TaxID=1690608 RepID=A0AAV9P3C7_9PEZI|nr:hypothetical protein LTR77_008595 [Saxophila tyrrhenica]
MSYHDWRKHGSAYHEVFSEGLKPYYECDSTVARVPAHQQENAPSTGPASGVASESAPEQNNVMRTLPSQGEDNQHGAEADLSDLIQWDSDVDVPN